MIKKRVVAVRKNGEGDIMQYMFDDNTVVDYSQAIDMAKNREIENVNAFRGRDGEYHVRSNADGDPSNNLDNLPNF